MIKGVSAIRKLSQKLAKMAKCQVHFLRNIFTTIPKPMVNEWQNRLLSEKIIPLMTDVYIKREENRVLSKAVI